MSLATEKVRSARPLSSIRVEIAVILSVLLFGIPMIILIPPGAGYDEEDHLVRVWELSRFSFLPGELPPQEMQYPIVFRDFAYRQQGSSGVITSNFWQKYIRASLYEDGVVRREINTKSVYSPLLLLPQAIALRLSVGSLSLPALLVFFACRLASLLSYLALVWLAVRLIPFGKWILFVLAASPMALFQAATVTPDAISNGIGFMLIAGTLRIAQTGTIGWKEMGRLILLIFLLFHAKLNLIPLVLLPFLLLPPARFADRRAFIALVGMTLMLFVVEVAGWNILAAGRSDALMANDANPTAQMLHILTYPLSFLVIVIRDLVANGWMYFQTWINGYGYFYWTPPLLVSIFFLLALGGALLRESIRERLNPRYRPVFVLVFAGGYLAALLAVYLTFTPAGSQQILGMQGRYFVPLALLLLLALSGTSWISRVTAPASKWIVLLLGTALFLNVAGIYLAFHVPCGTTYYQTGLCYQPLSREFTESRPSPAISSEMSLTQEFQVTCNGLSEVRLLLHPSTPGNGATTRFLLRGPGGKTLLDTSAVNNTISAEEWYALRFEPDWESEGQVYALTVLGSENSTGQELRAFYTVQPEFDLGTLVENGQPVEEDLILQYGCTTGLRKLWLTGKP